MATVKKPVPKKTVAAKPAAAVKASAPVADEPSLLTRIAAATNSPVGYGVVISDDKEEADTLASDGLIEMSSESTYTNSDGMSGFAARVTPAGNAALAESDDAVQNTTAVALASDAAMASVPAAAPGTAPITAAVVDGAEAAEAAGFGVLRGIPMPVQRRFGKTTAYPFDALQVGECFFVPVSDKMPEPHKTMGSTLSNARKRYATEDAEGNLTLTRNFTSRRVMPNDGATYGHPGKGGAVIFRTA